MPLFLRMKGKVEGVLKELKKGCLLAVKNINSAISLPQDACSPGSIEGKGLMP